MKKLFTLLCASAMAMSMNAQTIQSFEVKSKADFTNALASIAGLPAGSTAYVYIQGYVDVGTLKNDASGAMQPTLRNIHFVGVNDPETGERATLSMEMQIPANNTEADGFSLHYENLKLRQTQGVWGNSKHLMNFKDANKHYVDTLEFVNCELTELCRSIYRGEVNGAGEDFTGAGTMKVFRMENCEVHNGFRQSNAMPAIYMAQPVNQMIFKNNTFYDLTYLNGLVSFGTMNENTGRQAVKVTFENNTVCAWSKSSLLGYAGGVSTESEFHIKNNIILQPNWVDDMNGRFGDSNSVHDGTATIEEDPAATNGPLTADEVQARIEKGVVLTNLDGGLVQQENNMLYGFKYQNLTDHIDAGNIIPIGDDENEETDFTFLTMEDVDFSWSDFVDAQNDKFQINDKHKVHSAGKNGAPLGNINNYTDQVIAPVAVNISAVGSSTVSVIIDPVKEKYFTGDKITVTLIDHNSALRTINTFKGWSDGSMDTVRQFDLTEDLNLVATYEEAVSGIVSYFDFSETPAAGQNKLPDYKADVYAEGNQAVATLMYWAEAVEADEEQGIEAKDAGYYQANGSENRFNWRAGKFGEDPADQQINVLSRKSSAAAIANNTPDYLVFTFSTKNLTNVVFSAFCGTDNFGYKTQLADYSIDGGATWVNFAKVDLEGRDAEFSIGAGKLWGWNELKGQLPEAAENQETVLVRVIGDVNGEKVDNVVSEIDQTSANMFEYLGSVVISTGSNQDGIATVANSSEAKTAPIYNFMGIRVSGQNRGLFIQNGKKFVVK